MHDPKAAVEAERRSFGQCVYSNSPQASELQTQQ